MSLLPVNNSDSGAVARAKINAAISQLGETIIVVYDTAANFTSINPVFPLNYIGIETDGLATNPKFKISDGVTAWNALPYAGGGPLAIVLATGNTTGANNIIVSIGQNIQGGTGMIEFYSQTGVAITSDGNTYAKPYFWADGVNAGVSRPFVGFLEDGLNLKRIDIVQGASTDVVVSLGSRGLRVFDDKVRFTHPTLIDYESALHMFKGDFNAASPNGNVIFNLSDLTVGMSYYHALGAGNIQADISATYIQHSVENQFISPLNTFDSAYNKFLGNIYINNNLGVDSPSHAGTKTLNIGAANADVINIGRAGAILNLLGAVINEYATNAYVTDKLITLNDGGAVSSGIGVGFEIEENNVITGYLKTNAARNGFSILVPAIAFSADLNLNLLTDNRVYVLQDKSGTIAHLDDITGSGTLELLAVISQTNTPSGTITGDRFLVDLVPTGVFVGHSNEIAEYDSGTGLYTFTTPITNNTVFVTATLTTLRFNGTSWVAYNGTAILQNGNTLTQLLIIGTNDNYNVRFKRNNVLAAEITSTGFALRNAANTFNVEIQNAVTANRTVTMPDGDITVLGRITTAPVAGQIPFYNDVNRVKSVTNFTYTAGLLYSAMLANTSGSSQLILSSISNTRGNLALEKWSDGASLGNYTGTSIGKKNTSSLANRSINDSLNNAVGSGALVLGGYNGVIALTSTSSTAFGYKIDNVGFRIGEQSTLHVANTASFEVTSGISIFGGTIRLKSYTVATLPVGVQGDEAFVTDALAPAYLTPVVGGGAVVVKVFFNGTNWIT